MSYRVYFALSTGLSKSVTVPNGTLDRILGRIQKTEAELGLETDQYKNNPKHWRTTEPKEGITDDIYCQVAEEHNHFIRWLYNLLERCFEKPTEGGEVITPEQSMEFWHGLQTIDVPFPRWTRDYFVNRMSAFYDVMRGREEDGIIFDADPLTEKQAASVINIFSSVLDAHDVRLDAPKNRDYLAAMDDGGYAWCEKCGAVTWEDALNCDCEDCPVRAEYGIEDSDEEL